MDLNLDVWLQIMVLHTALFVIKCIIKHYENQPSTRKIKEKFEDLNFKPREIYFGNADLNTFLSDPSSKKQLM